MRNLKKVFYIQLCGPNFHIQFTVISLQKLTNLCHVYGNILQNTKMYIPFNGCICCILWLLLGSSHASALHTAVSSTSFHSSHDEFSNFTNLPVFLHTVKRWILHLKINIVLNFINCNNVAFYVSYYKLHVQSIL